MIELRFPSLNPALDILDYIYINPKSVKTTDAALHARFVDDWVRYKMVNYPKYVHEVSETINGKDVQIIKLTSEGGDERERQKHQTAQRWGVAGTLIMASIGSVLQKEILANTVYLVGFVVLGGLLVWKSLK